jgi:very-short-patch-repair endonuclease
MAAVLAGGDTALASHRAAAQLWELEGINDGIIEISAKAGRRIRGAVTHRRGSRDDPHAVLVSAVPTTGVERTLIDLAAVVGPHRTGIALDDALRRGRTSLRDLHTEIAKYRNRAGLRTLRRLLTERDPSFERAESALESAFLRLIGRHDLPNPIAQFTVRGPDDRKARLDFAYPSVLLGVELDGYRWHSGMERWKNDLRRENHLKLMGWTVLRFTWEDVHDRPESVSAQLREALDLSGFKLSR